MNLIKNVILKYTFQSIALVLIIFLTISFIVLMDIKITSQELNNSIGIFNTEKLFVQFIKSENHTFFPKMDETITTSKISNIVFQLFTTIKPTDARTFLGNELPGLMQYETEVVIAGEGTNLTNLPYESSPPTEVLLNEKKVAEEQLNQSPSTDPPVTNPEHKSVFIYHTHSWEAFLPLLKDAKVPNDAISSDNRVNVVGLGERLANDLMKNKIGVLHDNTNMTQELRSKGLKSTQAYSESRKIVQEAAAHNRVLKYYIDIHRDSARSNVTTKTINGVSYARLYFVIGKENKNYLENLEMAKTLNKNLETKFPGISRGVFLKTYSEGNGVYNQDISNKAILLEIGGVDNDLAELNRTVDAFSEVLTDYYWKSNEAKEVNGNG